MNKRTLQMGFHSAASMFITWNRTARTRDTFNVQCFEFVFLLEQRKKRKPNEQRTRRKNKFFVHKHVLGAA